MLTRTLRTLERDALIGRNGDRLGPAEVDYELTALGEELLTIRGRWITSLRASG